MGKVLSDVLLTLKARAGGEGHHGDGVNSSEPTQLNGVLVRIGKSLKAKVELPNLHGHDQQQFRLLRNPRQNQNDRRPPPLTDISNHQSSSTTITSSSTLSATRTGGRKRTLSSKVAAAIVTGNDTRRHNSTIHSNTTTTTIQQQDQDNQSIATDMGSPIVLDTCDARGVGLSQCLGSRRLHMEEIVELSINDSFYIVIPTETRRESKTSINMRKNFTARVVDSVLAARPRHFANHSPEDRRKHCHGELVNKTSFLLNGRQYLEFCCSLVGYPHRNEYVNDLFDASEIEQQVRQGGGLLIRLLDYSKTPSDTTLLKWCEVPYVQFFVQHFRGDPRPMIKLTDKRNMEAYGESMAAKFDEVEGCYIQTTELRLAFEEHRTRTLTKSLAQANEKLNTTLDEMHSQLQISFTRAIQYEIGDGKLAACAKAIDNIYEHALRNHFSDFQTYGRLLDDSIDMTILEMIQLQFPFLYTATSSMIFGTETRAHQPSTRKLPGYDRKQRALVQHFLALIRERNPKYLIHWAAIRTLAMYVRGNRAKHYQAPHSKAYTSCLPVALNYASNLFESTREARQLAIQLKKIIMHSLDNYNQYHPYKTQRGGSSGIYHIGLVYNVVMALEFKRPIGTILKNLESNTYWRVKSSALPDFWRNMVELEQVDATNHDIIITMAPTTHPVSLTASSMDWMVISMPGASPQVPITYIDQVVPSSFRQYVPVGLSDGDFVLGNRAWMDENDEPTEAAGMEKLCPRKYVGLLKSSLRMMEFFRYCKQYIKRHPVADDAISEDDADEDPLLSFFRQLEKLMKDSPRLHTNCRNFQKDCLQYWNKAYDAPTKFIWMPICPRDEMKTDEFMLAMVHIFCSLGLIKEEADGSYSRVTNSSRRVVFQFGDALTVQKWYNLSPHIVSKITEIGKEDYVAMMMDAYDRFVICHDYLHENIHRLQVVFTLFYGGFIQVAQILLGTTKVQKDPTKGIWVHHERLVLKMIHALERIRMEEFIRHRDNARNIFSSETDNAEVCWRLQCEYQTYCEKLLQSSCEKTLAAANFLNLAQEWQMCKESVSAGDWATLEVLGNDWLLYWAAMGKKQYKLEVVRRMEQIYKLKADELEYLRIGRFVRLDEGSEMTTHDDMCEKQNQAQKNCAKNSDFKIVCNRSAFLHAGIRCAKEVFVDKNKPSSIPNLEDDVEALYEFFRRTGVFVHPTTPSKLHDNSFWDHIVGSGMCFDGTETKRKYSKKKNVPVDAHDREALQVFLNKDALAWDNDCNSDGDDDEDDSISGDDDRSVGSHNTRGSSSGGDGGSTGNDFDTTMDDDVSIAAKASDEDSVDQGGVENPEIVEMKLNNLLKQGKLPRYKMNMMCIKNVSAIGRDKLPDFKETRQKEREEMKRTVEMNYSCNSNFTKKMKSTIDDLEEKMKKLQTEPQREEMDWEKRRSLSLQLYDDGFVEEYDSDDIEEWDDGE